MQAMQAMQRPPPPAAGAEVERAAEAAQSAELARAAGEAQRKMQQEREELRLEREALRKEREKLRREASLQKEMRAAALPEVPVKVAEPTDRPSDKEGRLPCRTGNKAVAAAAAEAVAAAEPNSDDQLWEVLKQSMKQKSSSSEPTVMLDLVTMWTPVWKALPATSFGRGPHTQHLGVLFGQRNASGILRLDGAELLPTAFVWEPPIIEGRGRTPSLLDQAAQLAASLESALRAFLAETFEPWAAQQAEASKADRNCVGWFLCNDGEAFALSKPLLELGSSGGEPWRRLVVVADRAKSSAEDPAVEVVKLGGSKPERLLFDLNSTPERG
mmetsp:Transcript_68638/g.149388  ORF Transcript_68638/g.149388 Transcript_68638/m.149388 type:complete len:329 (-) Transcript_68638:86-1072(-)